MEDFALYKTIRNQTEVLCNPLEIEDYVIQGSADVSPIKWHLGHTTWFFERFLLIPFLKNYRPFNELFISLFNSYYQILGNPYPRINRGLLSRPTVKTVYAYRRYVDEHMGILINTQKDNKLLIMGLQHEQQHQELILMDIKFNYSLNIDSLSYQKNSSEFQRSMVEEEFIHIPATQVFVGHQTNDFCYDNELPVHMHILSDFMIANRLVTNAEYLFFIESGGYANPQYWLSDGWDCVVKNEWQSPLYWSKLEDDWYQFTLQGLQKLNPYEPVCHVSYYEADAYARFRGRRLPTEIEWEHVAKTEKLPSNGHFMENQYFHPTPAKKGTIQQLFGDVWEWTMSNYSPYPGYKPFQEPFSEYNGKFMCNQMVLRGGSCITPLNHIRSTYRNFFQPEKRWQFSGIRLASTMEN